MDQLAGEERGEEEGEMRERDGDPGDLAQMIKAWDVNQSS